MTVICNRVIRTIADLREFCDAVESASKARSWQLELSTPLEMWLTRIPLPGHRFCHDIHWDIADPEVVAEIEAAMAAEDAAARIKAAPVREPAAKGPLDAAPYVIADRFVTILRSWLTPAEWLEMCKRNAVQTNGHICHSHDFCDANMAMCEAFESVMGKTPDGDNEDEAKLWGHAWELAMPTLRRNGHA